MFQALVACNILILIHYSRFIKRHNVKLHHGIPRVGTYHYSVLRLDLLDIVTTENSPVYIDGAGKVLQDLLHGVFSRTILKRVRD